MIAQIKSYDNYKPVDIRWLNSIPSNWELKRISTIVGERKVKNNEYKYQNAFQFKFGRIVDKKQLGTDEELKTTYEKYTIVYKNDIVINGLNLNYDFVTQRVGLVNKTGIITSAYISITPNEFINSNYLYLLLKSLDDRKMLNGMGTGIRLTLSFSELKKQYLPLPSLPEQDQIVKFLDFKISKINKFIKNKKREIELLKELKQAEINRAVTKGLNPNVPMKDSGFDWLGEIPEHWEVRRLKTFCDFVNRGTTPNYTDEKIFKVANQATFSKGYWDTKNIRYTNSSIENNRGKLLYDDILLASTGGGVLGKVYLFKANDIYIADSHITIIRDSIKRFVPEYLFYFLSINYHLINSLLAQGSTNQIELQRNSLRSMFFPLPSIQEQEQIRKHLDNLNTRINSVIDSIKYEIQKITEYKTSLISEVVTGKIDVRDIIEDTENELLDLEDTVIEEENIKVD